MKGVNSANELPLKKGAKRRQKQRWPFIKKRVYPSGAVAWMVDARTKSGGERKSFETLNEAETYAEQCRIRRQNEGDGAFGNEELAKYGKTVQDAINFYLAHLRRMERSIPVRDAMAELIDLRAKTGKSRRYCYDLGHHLGRFVQDFGDRPAASVETKEIDAWLVGLGLAPGTRNTFRRDVVTLFSFCEKRGYVATNPAAHTEAAKEIDAAPGILTIEECKRVLHTCPPELLAYTAIGLFAGLRAEEIAKLDWSEVDLAHDIIEVKAHKAKTAKRRIVRIEPVLRAWLEPIAKASGPVSPRSRRHRLEVARRLAGFGTTGTETEEEKAAGVQLKEWPANALRHSFGSYWLAKYEDAAKLALQMGNSPQMVFQHYRELVRPKDAATFWELRPDQ